MRAKRKNKIYLFFFFPPTLHAELVVTSLSNSLMVGEITEMKFNERSKRLVSSLAVLLGMLLGMAWAGHAFTDYGCVPAEKIL